MHHFMEAPVSFAQIVIQSVLQIILVVLLLMASMVVVNTRMVSAVRTRSTVALATQNVAKMGPDLSVLTKMEEL